LAWINLRGAFMSLAIGVIIYIFIVRICLMSKDAKGRSIYLNIWPSSVDIEKRVYRPLLLNLLPFLGAMFARITASIIPAVTAGLYRGFVAFRHFWVTENAKAPEPGILSIAQDMTAKANTKPEQPEGDARTVARIAHMLNARFSGDFMKVIFGSLAYSLLIFFVGFTIVQLIVFVI